MHIVVSCIVFALHLHTSSAQYVVINTTLGTIVGKLNPEEYSGHRVYEYLGIPYAEPPIGENRFRAPVQKNPWNETRNAVSFGSVCPQSPSQLRSALLKAQTDEGLAGIAMDEDCLFLNIYQPNVTSQNLAVMVFFHGGDFIGGTGSAYSGAVLSSSHDVIVVTINYRLGAFGFLSNGDEALPGNYGLLDQQLALRWVKENIEAFNGDPNRITIFGSGSGGSSVHLHTLIEKSRGLFQRAIVQSASYNDEVLKKETAKEHYDEFMKALLGPDPTENIDEVNYYLRHNATATEIVLASESISSWRPVISNIIPVEPREAMKGEAVNQDLADIDMMVGSNSLDAFQLTQSIDVENNENWYHDTVRDITQVTSEFEEWNEEDVEKRMKMFDLFYNGFYSNLNESSLGFFKSNSIALIFTDQLYGTWAQEIAMTQPVWRIYKYLFKANPATLTNGQGNGFYGAHNGDELAYLFGFMTTSGTASLVEIALSYQLMEIWTEFAKSGYPGNMSLPLYVPYSYSEPCRSTIVLNTDKIEIISDLETPRNWDFWSRYYATMGLSCTSTVNSGSDDSDNSQDGTDDDGICEPGVWSDAGVVMTNDVAGALLITFICLTAALLIIFLIACHQNHKMKRKIKKILKDDYAGSVVSNVSSKL